MLTRKNGKTVFHRDAATTFDVDCWSWNSRGCWEDSVPSKRKEWKDRSTEGKQEERTNRKEESEWKSKNGENIEEERKGKKKGGNA